MYGDIYAPATFGIYHYIFAKAQNKAFNVTCLGADCGAGLGACNYKYKKRTALMEQYRERQNQIYHYITLYHQLAHHYPIFFLKI